MIKKKIEIDSIVCDCFFTDNSHSMVYIIMPEKVVLKDMEIQADKFNINITVISGMDWNNDMTPWKAPGVRKQDPEFGENADQFLAMLINRIVPETESEIKGVVNNRIIIGTSLSGLFALWAWVKSSVFSSVGSLSGSFWYDGFTEWFCNQPVINRKGKVFLSLGEIGRAHV